MEKFNTLWHAPQIATMASGYAPKVTTARNAILIAVSLWLGACASDSDNSQVWTWAWGGWGSAVESQNPHLPSGETVDDDQEILAKHPDSDDNPCIATDPTNFLSQSSIDGNDPDIDRLSQHSRSHCEFWIPTTATCWTRAPDFTAELFKNPMPAEAWPIDYRACARNPLPGDEALSAEDNIWQSEHSVSNDDQWNILDYKRVSQ